MPQACAYSGWRQDNIGYVTYEIKYLNFNKDKLTVRPQNNFHGVTSIVVGDVTFVDPKVLGLALSNDECGVNHTTGLELLEKRVVLVRERFMNKVRLRLVDFYYGPGLQIPRVGEKGREETPLYNSGMLHTSNSS